MAPIQAAMESSFAAEDIRAEHATAADPLKLYVRQIGSGALLTREEERELARRKDEGDEDPVSLEPPGGDGESLYGDLIEAVNSLAPHEQSAEQARGRELAGALEQLNPRMRRVLSLRFGLDGEPPQTLEEVGSQLGITRERVRQLETRALRELRQANPGLEHYLRAE